MHVRMHDVRVLQLHESDGWSEVTTAHTETVTSHQDIMVSTVSQLALIPLVIFGRDLVACSQRLVELAISLRKQRATNVNAYVS